MGKIASKSTRFYVDDLALSGSLSAIDMGITQELPDVTCISDVGPRRVKGNYAHTHALRGFFEGGSSMIDGLASTMLGTTQDHYLAELFGGTAEGSICYESIVQLKGDPIKAASGAAVVLDLNAEGANGMARGRVLASAAALASTTGLLTSVDEGAQSTSVAGTYAAVFRAVSGAFTNCVMQVQDSSNGTSWGDSAGLTATFTTMGVSRVTSTAVLLQYKRVACTTVVGGTAEILVTGGVVTGSVPLAS